MGLRIFESEFSNKTRQELEAMFGLTEWRQTRFYQEVKEEVEEEAKLNAKLETIPELLKVGLNIEQIAQALKLDIELVRNTIGKLSRE